MLMKNVTVDKCLMLLTCAAAVSISTGCRSMSGMNMFSLRSKPSAEALAGAGPSATYPPPPSDSATPEAIASIAGGTNGLATTPETAQVGGFDVLPGYATPATNLAAAQANGIYSGSTPPGLDPAGTSQAAASGYTFGSKTFTPKSPAITPPDSSSYALAASSTAGSTGVTAPSTSITPPPSAGFSPPSAGFAPPSMNNYTAPAPPSSTASGGFDLPSDPPSLAAGPTPSMSFPSTATPPPPTTDLAPPASVAPSFSTASVAPTITAPSTASTTSGIPSFGGDSYSPGSTGTALSYPLGDVQPTTSGSIFR
jgi:hypothetical protein